MQALTLPRRLAIQLLHEAQVHGEQACGLISEDFVLHPLAKDADAESLPGTFSKRVWASYDMGVSRFNFPRRLVISIETAMELRGVLKMRCYETADGKTCERTLSILENT